MMEVQREAGEKQVQMLVCCGAGPDVHAEHARSSADAEGNEHAREIVKIPSRPARPCNGGDAIGSARGRDRVEQPAQ
jgi:hypothetical protein